MPPQSNGNRFGDRVRSPRIRVSVPGKAPIRIERYEHVRNVAGEDPLPQRTLEFVLKVCESGIV